MKARTLITATLMLLTASFAHADDVEETKKQINSIKKSSQYIYAEVTAATESEAKDLAEEILYEEINKWAANQKKLKNSPTFVVNNKHELYTSMSMPRGNMYRSFVYVKKSDIQPAENTQVIANTNPNANTQEGSSVSLIVPDAVRELAACTEYSVLAEKIQAMKGQGRVKSYARYAQLNNPDACYLAIYNTAGKVVAILTPGAQRTNIATGQSDGVANYRGCGAIGFEIAE